MSQDSKFDLIQQSQDRLQSQVNQMAQDLGEFQKILHHLNQEVTELRKQLSQTLSESTQQSSTVTIAERTQFHNIVKSYLRKVGNEGKPHLQIDLADAVHLSEGELSDRLRGRRVLTQENVQNIVKTLLIWGKIKTRAEATNLFQLMGCPDFSPDKWRDLEKTLGENFPKLEAGQKERFREALNQQDLTELIQQRYDQEHGYSRAFLEAFIQDKSEPEGLRIRCLELYYNLYSFTDILPALLEDPHIHLQLAALKAIPRHKLTIDTTLLRKAYTSPEQEIVLNAVRAAKFSVLEQGMNPVILIDEHVVQHKYWLIRLIAIRAIVERFQDESDEQSVKQALELLSAFKTTKYFRSREEIYHYIERSFEQQLLTGTAYTLAVDHLTSMINDGRSSEDKIVRMQGILERITGTNRDQE
jgi:hypothetical protein